MCVRVCGCGCQRTLKSHRPKSLNLGLWRKAESTLIAVWVVRVCRCARARVCVCVRVYASVGVGVCMGVCANVCATKELSKVTAVCR